MLTFCICSISNMLFKIVFLFETTFIFPQHYLSHEVCMVYLASYWLSAYLLPFVGMSTLLWLGAWNFLPMAIKIRNFKRYLCCVRVENLFTIRIFEISAKICICPCNFKAQLLLTKIRLINAKSQIQPRWHPSFPEIPGKSKLSSIISGQCLHISKKLTMQQCSLLPGASTGTVGFQNSVTLFLALEMGNYSKIYLLPDLVCIDHYT